MGGDLTAAQRTATPPGVVPCQVRVEHPEFGVLGFIAIDSGVWRRSVGGIRLAPDVSAEQVADLARTMTYKFAFLRMPLGGAKGAIVASPDWCPERQPEMLRYFGAAIGPLVRRGVYTPGTDLGVGPQECALVLEGAGLIPPGTAAAAPAVSGDEAGFPTGLTVFLAACAALESLGRPVAGATVAVEGFGKVGGAAVRLFAEAGARIEAVSTRQAALHQPAGLDVGELLRLRAHYGDAALLHYKGAQTISPAQLYALPVDVLCPCGGQWTLRSDGVDTLSCRILCPGANCVVHPEARAAFAARLDVLSIPDFVANCGSVLDGNLPGGRALNERLLRRGYGHMIRKLLASGARLGVPVAALARQVAEDALQEVAADPARARARERFVGWSTRMVEHPLAPGAVGALLARRFARMWLPAIPDRAA
jgi:glutamate dehydrogenase (NAD(P)+)